MKDLNKLLKQALAKEAAYGRDMGYPQMMNNTNNENLNPKLKPQVQQPPATGNSQAMPKNVADVPVQPAPFQPPQGPGTAPAAPQTPQQPTAGTLPTNTNPAAPQTPQPQQQPQQPQFKTNIGGMYRQASINDILKDALAKKAKSPAWQRSEGKSDKGGLNEKGRKSYERANPGSNLKAPSKKKGNPRRASFCARMKGMKKKLTSEKTRNDPDSRINKSLRAWNC